MYRVIIYGCPDKFDVAARGKEFNRRGLIRFLSRHVNKLVDCKCVAVARDHGPACAINYFLVAKDMSDLVGKKHMSDRIPTHRISLP